MQFFLNVFTELAEFSDKRYVITVKGLEPLSARDLLCERPACYHSGSTTHVRDRIFKLSPIHASVIISFPEFSEFSESYFSFRKNYIGSERNPTGGHKHTGTQPISFDQPIEFFVN